MRGISDRTECDVCGKTNLKLTIAIESEDGSILYYGSDCATKVMRLDYMGKRLPISRAGIISMGHSAKRGESFAKLSTLVKE